MSKGKQTMKLTKQALKRIIREEIQRALQEGEEGEYTASEAEGETYNFEVHSLDMEGKRRTGLMYYLINVPAHMVDTTNSNDPRPKMELLKQTGLDRGLQPSTSQIDEVPEPPRVIDVSARRRAAFAHGEVPRLTGQAHGEEDEVQSDRDIRQKYASQNR